MRKRGNILIENVIFIILNVVFISILIFFVLSKANDASVMEEEYAKQIALMIDSARPGMIINLTMENAIEKAKENFGEEDFEKMINIDGNKVTVGLRKDGGYSYSFFNDVEVSYYPLDDKNYIFIIDEKENREEIQEETIEEIQEENVEENLGDSNE